MTKLEAIQCDKCGRLFNPTIFHYEFYGMVTGSNGSKRDSKMRAMEANPLCFCSLNCLVQRIDDFYKVLPA